MSCTICYEDTKEYISVTKCYHEYHQSCFDKWIHNVQVIMYQLHAAHAGP